MDTKFTKLLNNSYEERDQPAETSTFPKNIIKLSTIKLSPL